MLKEMVILGVCACPVLGWADAQVRKGAYAFERGTVLSADRKDELVFDGPVSNLCWGATSAGLEIRGTVTFRGGVFTGERQTRHRGYPTTLSVRKGAKAIVENVPVQTPGVDFRQTQPGEVHLAVAGNQYRDWYVQMGTLVCEARNVLNPDRGLVLWKDNHGGGYVGKVDINGHDQNVAELRSTDPKCDPAKQIVNSGSKGVFVAKRYLVNGREMPPGWYGSCVVVPQHDGRFPPKPTSVAYPEYKPSRDVRTVHPRDGVGNFLSKCRAGKAVNVAYFGGSITAMNGWRNLTTDWLRTQYPSATINEIAASIGGTGSDLGVFRIKKDVLEKKPDLVFVEFAVNDGDKAPRLIWRQMEGIVRQIWRQDPKTDIVFCYTVAGGIFNEYARGSYNRSAAAMEQVADFYGIPSISLGVPAVELFKQGKLVVSKGEFATAVPKEDPDHDRKVRELMAKDARLLFANDGVHPRPEGHALYLEAVKTAFAAMKGLKAVDHARRLDKAFCPDNWENARVVVAEPSFLVGDWRQEQDAKLKGLWRADKPGAAIRFRFAGSACRIRMCFQPDGGIMKVRVDGKECPDVVAFDRYSTYVRDGSVTVFDGAYGVHDVELMLSDLEPDRTILSSQFADPKAELVKPRYHGTVFRLRELMLIGTLVGERVLEVSPSGLSPQAALRRIREAKASGDTSAWTVNVKSGVYPLEEALVFTPSDSGTAEAPVVWRGDGEASILSGTIEVSGWTDTGKGWWEAPIPKNADGTPIWFEQLWANGRRADNSRWPKSGYLVPGECGQDVTTEGAGKDMRHRTREFLTVTDKSLKDALDRTPSDELPYVHLRVHQKWSATWRPLVGWDGKCLRTVGTSPWNWSAKWNEEAIYFLANLRAGFTAQGDWFYDRKAGKVLYRPRSGETLKTFRAQVPRPGLSTVVSFVGEPARGRYVDHIRFEKLAFSGCDATRIEGGAGPTTWYNGQSARAFDGFVDAVGARNVCFSDCSVRHTGNHAVRFRDGCFSNRFERCVFEDIGAGGLWIGADDLRFAKDEKYAIARREVMTYSPSANAFNAIVDCIVRDGGHVNPSGSAIVIGHASDCLVEHCEIADFFYTGISVGWQWAYRPTAAMRNVIRFNRIHDFGKGVLSDMGGVYTLGTAFGTRVTDNVIYNVKSRTYGGWGLYADEGTEGVVFERNLVYNTHDGGFHQHYGAGNIVRNNIFAWNEQNGVIRTIRANVFNVRSSLDVVNNIVLTERGDLASYGVLGVEGVWANNVWWSTTGEAKLCGLNWEEWEKTGKESNGRFADPKFVDAKNFDFRLKPDSPALLVGFRPFDFSRAGVTSSMKRK